MRSRTSTEERFDLPELLYTAGACVGQCVLRFARVCVTRPGQLHTLRSVNAGKTGVQGAGSSHICGCYLWREQERVEKKIRKRGREKKITTRLGVCWPEDASSAFCLFDEDGPEPGFHEQHRQRRFPFCPGARRDRGRRSPTSAPIQALLVGFITRTTGTTRRARTSSWCSDSPDGAVIICLGIR